MPFLSGFGQTRGAVFRVWVDAGQRRGENSGVGESRGCSEFGESQGKHERQSLEVIPILAKPLDFQ